MSKRVTILGSTGSVGTSTVDLILNNPEAYDIQALTAQTNVDRLADQAIQLKAKRAVIGDETHYTALKNRLAGTGIDCAAGRAAVIEAASMPTDWTMAAIVGMAGLEPILAAIAQGQCVAIANKEPLVAAGPLVMAAARASGATLLPVDSEHNAVFQVFENENRAGIDRIILTASGGPFRTWTMDQMRAATPAQAVAHPNWTMGAKISVDSASMMNKALEIIEAHYLFAMPPEQIDVLVHPQSVIHSMVEYADGSVLAQLGAPDMRTPIAYTLGWPDRIRTSGQRLDLKTLTRLDFEQIDPVRFPSIPMAYDCLRAGPAHCIAFNAANEVAVAAFLGGQIGFYGIMDAVRYAVERVEKVDMSNLSDVLDFDGAVRDDTTAYMNSHHALKSA